jgi:hypothetical protein
MQAFEWLLLAMTLGGLWIAKEAVLNRKKVLLFQAGSTESRLVSIALFCIPLVQILFPDPQHPATPFIWVCDILIVLAGILMFLAKSGITEEMILVNSLRYRYENIVEYRVSKNTAKGRTELFFRTKLNQRKLHFPLSEYSQITKFMQEKKNPKKKKTKSRSNDTAVMEQQ